MKIFKFFKRKRFKSFTLIEMMIVMLIAVILAGVAVPYFWGGYGSMEFKGSARRIASILRTAKSYADTENVNFDVLMWTSNTGGDYQNKIDIDIYRGPWSDWDKVGKTEKIELGYAFDITSILNDTIAPWGGYYITFKPDGTADDEDGTVMDETITITNMKKGKSINISILEDTGRVKISDIQ